VRRLEDELASVRASEQALRDEVDLSRDKVRQWSSMEQTLARYKQKLDESADLRKRVKEAEDAKEVQDERVATLETELAKLQTLKVSDDQHYSLV
jgi:protein HOOK3